MRIPLIGMDELVVTTVDQNECLNEGALFIGSGAARRTFIFKGGNRPSEHKFVEVRTKYIRTNGMLSRPDAVPPDKELFEQNPLEGDDRDAIHIELQPGQRICLTLADTDGAYVVSYDYKNDGRLFVYADMEGNVHGDEGIIHEENFRVSTGCTGHSIQAEPM